MVLNTSFESLLEWSAIFQTISRNRYCYCRWNSCGCPFRRYHLRNVIYIGSNFQQSYACKTLTWHALDSSGSYFFTRDSETSKLPWKFSTMICQKYSLLFILSYSFKKSSNSSLILNGYRFAQFSPPTEKVMLSMQALYFMHNIFWWIIYWKDESWFSLHLSSMHCAGFKWRHTISGFMIGGFKLYLITPLYQW